MRRPYRALAISGILGAVLVLAGCGQNPPPKVTVQTGSFSTTITPSSYCSDATHCHTYSDFNLPDVHAGSAATVLIDVPAEVANTGWSVQSLSMSGVQTLSSSGALHHQNSYRIAANTNGGNPFVVAISQVRNGRSDDSRWSFVVLVSQG